MADFNAAVDFVLQHEDPGLTGVVTHDSGGTTRWGISQKAYPALDVAHLSLPDAKSIYRQSYWGPIGGALIHDQNVANKLLDMAVSMGVETAVRFAQEAVSVEEDGIMGPVTMEALNAADPQAALADLRYLSEHRYREIAEANPREYGRYLDGWMKRAES